MNRTCLWTYERLREKTKPYCTRCKQTHLAITYKWWYMRKDGMMFLYPEAWGRHWYKESVTELWLN